MSIGPSAERSSQIPKHWNFPERGREGLKVDELDLKKGYLAVSEAPKTDSMDSSHKYWGEIDYLFDSVGEPRRYRYVRLDTPRHESRSLLGSSEPKREATIIDTGDISTIIEANDKPVQRYAESLWFYFLPQIPKRLSYTISTDKSNQLAYLSYKEGTFNNIKFGTLFRPQFMPGDKVIESPHVGIQLFSIGAPQDSQHYEAKHFFLPEAMHQTEKWRYEPLDPTKETPTEYSILHYGKPLFTVRWAVQNGIIVLEQQYIPSEEEDKPYIKQLAAPLRFDQDQVRARAFAPASRDPESEKLTIPWETMRESLGVSLNYSTVRDESSDQRDDW